MTKDELINKLANKIDWELFYELKELALKRGYLKAIEASPNELKAKSMNLLALIMFHSDYKDYDSASAGMICVYREVDSLGKTTFGIRFEMYEEGKIDYV